MFGFIKYSKLFITLGIIFHVCQYLQVAHTKHFPTILYTTRHKQACKWCVAAYNIFSLCHWATMLVKKKSYLIMRSLLGLNLTYEVPSSLKTRQYNQIWVYVQLCISNSSFKFLHNGLWLQKPEINFDSWYSPVILNCK